MLIQNKSRFQLLKEWKACGHTVLAKEIKNKDFIACILMIQAFVKTSKIMQFNSSRLNITILFSLVHNKE